MNQEKEPFAEETPRRPVWVFVTLVVVVLVLALGAYLLFFRGQESESSSKIGQMQELVTKIRGLESEVQDKQDEIFELIGDYKNQTGQELLPANVLNLSDEEREILEKKIREEQNVSIRSLLNDILDKNKEISELRAEIKKAEALLPSPHMVEKGENHYQIAMDFLLNTRGVDKKKALRLIERTALFEPLVPGFKVWNFYSGEDYGTFVTQGTAAISPNQIRRQAKKALVDARDQAISERDKLADDIKTLGERREELIEQVDTLSEEREGLITRISDMNKDNLEMQRAVNSVHFLLDLEKNLKKRGVIKGGFLKSLKLKTVSPEYFKMSMDLREDQSIHVSAGAFALKKIRKITLFPRIFRRDEDYTVTIAPDRQNGTVTFKSLDKFKSEKVVISVE